jgi:hypothetical protein
VRHIVALRGDMGQPGAPFVPHPDGYQNAADLVAGLKRVAPFEISVAAYPESHPDSPSVEADIDNLKRKLDAGATRAISQFFFEPETFFRYRDRLAAAGIDAPVLPGILPVSNFAQTQKFAAACGAEIPAWMAGLFEGLDTTRPHALWSRRRLRRNSAASFMRAVCVISTSTRSTALNCPMRSVICWGCAQPRADHCPKRLPEMSLIPSALAPSAARKALLEQSTQRILITDGAFGTEIQNYGLSEADYAGNLGLGHDQKGNNDILALTKPEVPEAIHRAYFAAGADLAETNTFSANRISQADYGAEHLVRDINIESAKLARRVADEFTAKDGRPRLWQAPSGRRTRRFPFPRRERPRLPRDRLGPSGRCLCRTGRSAGRRARTLS